MWKNTDIAYGSVSKTLHWLIFFLILFMLIYGYFLDTIPKDYQGIAYNIHKLTGVTILLLVVIRLIWKFVNVSPPLPADTPSWQVGIDHLVQWLLYISIIAMPVAGWVGSSSAGKPPHIGDLTLSLPIAQNKALISTAFTIHNTLAIVIIALVIIHILAALYHFFIKKDRVFQRMLPESKY